MDAEGTLQTIAEVAVTLAGFAALVALFRQRAGGAWTPAALSGLRFMIELSIMLIVLALLPLALRLLGVAEVTVWQSASAIYTVVSIGLLSLNISRLVRLTRAGWGPKTWGFHAVGFALGGLVIVANVWNTFVAHQAGYYVLGLVAGIFLVGLQFIAFSANRSATPQEN